MLGYGSSRLLFLVLPGKLVSSTPRSWEAVPVCSTEPWKGQALPAPSPQAAVEAPLPACARLRGRPVGSNPPNPSAPVPCTHRAVLSLREALGEQFPAPLLSALYHSRAQPGPQNRGVPRTEAPTIVEWIFVLNERDPQGTEQPFMLLGLSPLHPVAAALSWHPPSRHHLSPPLEDLREEGGAAICIFLFPLRKGRPGPLTCTPAWREWGRATARPT